MSVGQYREGFTWKQRKPNVNSDFGSDDATADAFRDNGTLWGQLITLDANYGDFVGAKTNVQTGQVRLNQWPTVGVLDYLVHLRFQEIWEITGVRRDGRQTIVDVTRASNQKVFDV